MMMFRRLLMSTVYCLLSTVYCHADPTNLSPQDEIDLLRAEISGIEELKIPPLLEAETASKLKLEQATTELEVSKFNGLETAIISSNAKAVEIAKKNYDEAKKNLLLAQTELEDVKKKNNPKITELEQKVAQENASKKVVPKIDEPEYKSITINQQSFSECLGDGKTSLAFDFDLPSQEIKIGKICSDSKRPSTPNDRMCSQYVTCADGTFRFTVCKCSIVEGNLNEENKVAQECIKDGIGTVAAGSDTEGSPYQHYELKVKAVER